jgi:hypothetical protein
MIVGIAVFFVLMIVVAAVIAYPLLPGRRPAEPVPVVTDVDIERAVRRLRQRRRSGLRCPVCGGVYAAGDQFCVHCGSDLSQAQPVEVGKACPSCGADLREGDVFCSKCGYRLVTGEEA